MLDIYCEVCLLPYLFIYLCGKQVKRTPPPVLNFLSGFEMYLISLGHSMSYTCKGNSSESLKCLLRTILEIILVYKSALRVVELINEAFLLILKIGLNEWILRECCFILCVH